MPAPGYAEKSEYESLRVTRDRLDLYRISSDFRNSRWKPDNKIKFQITNFNCHSYDIHAFRGFGGLRFERGRVSNYERFNINNQRKERMQNVNFLDQ